VRKCLVETVAPRCTAVAHVEQPRRYAHAIATLLDRAFEYPVDAEFARRLQRVGVAARVAPHRSDGAHDDSARGAQARDKAVGHPQFEHLVARATGFGERPEGQHRERRRGRGVGRRDVGNAVAVALPHEETDTDARRDRRNGTCPGHDAPPRLRSSCCTCRYRGYGGPGGNAFGFGRCLRGFHGGVWPRHLAYVSDEAIASSWHGQQVASFVAVVAAMTSTLSRASSAAKSGSRSNLPSARRSAPITFCRIPTPPSARSERAGDVILRLSESQATRSRPASHNGNAAARHAQKI
jgi:hypothetical protein